MIPPTLLQDGPRLLLEGADRKSVLLTQPDESLLRENCRQASLLPRGFTALFVGAAHIPHMDWKALEDRKILLIEKSRLVADHFLKNAALPPLTLIVGEEGYRLPGDTLPRQLHEDEAYGLVFKLFDLPDEIFQNIRLFNHLPSPAESLQYNELLKGLLLAIDAKRYHWKHAESYRAYKPRPQTLAGLIDNAEDGPWLKRFTLPPLGPMDKILPWHESEPRERLAAQPDLASAESLFQIKKCEALREWLKSERPSDLAWKNRTVFKSLGEILFSNEMLKRMGVNLHSLYVDWFHEQCFITQGGRFYFPYYSKGASQEKIGTIYRLDSLINPPPDGQAPMTYTPFVYTNPGLKLKKSGAQSRDDFQWDLVAVHHTRQQYCLDPLQNELFDLFAHTDPAHPNRAAFSHLEALRHSLKDHGLTTTKAKNLLNYLHFVFYCISRFCQVRSHLTALSAAGYRVALFGPQWSGFLPEAILHPPVYDPQALADVYHRALLVADFSPIFSKSETPYIGVFSAYAAGTPCALTRPVYPDSDLAPDLDIFRDMPFFGNVGELQSLIDDYASDIKARNEAVRSVQGYMERDFMDKAYPPQCLPLVPDAGRAAKFLASLRVRDWVVKAGAGYVHQMMGYPNLARELWAEAADNGGSTYGPLVYRLEQSRRGDH